jgi:hypothetical protein
MSLQDIVDTAVNVEVNRSKLVAQNVSRSGRISTNSRNFANPFRFVVTPKPVWTAAEYRSVFEPLLDNDRYEAHGMLLNNIDFTTGLATLGNSWMVDYQGYGDVSADNNNLDSYEATSATAGTRVILNYTGTTITSPTTKYIFKSGDYLRPSGSRYPYIATNDITVPVEITGVTGTVIAPGVTVFSNPRQQGANGTYNTSYIATATRTAITVSSSTGLTVGQIITKTSGNAVLGGLTYIANIDSATQISVISTTDIVLTAGASITFSGIGYDSVNPTDDWTVAIPIHRGYIGGTITASEAVRVGARAAGFNVIVTKLPQIRYLPGQLVELTSDIELIEEIL